MPWQLDRAGFILPLMENSGQSISPKSRALFAAGFLALLSIGGCLVVLHFTAELPAARPLAPAAPSLISSPPKESPESPDSAPPEPEIRPDAPEPPKPVQTMAELERAYLGHTDAREREQVVALIAGENDAAAVITLERLFSRETRPRLKEALVNSLADLDPALAPEVRHRLLSTALVKHPRNVRLAALSVLDNSEEPGVDAMIRAVKANDPDQEVRDFAQSLLKARKEDQADE